LWSALPEVPVDGLDFASAGDLLRDRRELGRAIPSLDCLIAALAMRHEVALLTLDAHFDGIEGLRLEALAG
jgi:predicted nucleic acid-binding protein